MKYALITGAYGGMGRETSKLLSRLGWTVFALDKKTEYESNGVIPIEVDVTSADSIACALKLVKAHTDRLDAIIHFAGIYDLDSLVEINEERFIRIFEINLFGVYRVNKTFLPMLSKGSKVVITTSELAPLDPLPFTGLYAVTKGALDKYALSLRMELQLLGITVCLLRPGAVTTTLLGDSTTALDKFCESTKLYDCNAVKFRNIVNRVEARSVPTIRIARTVNKILNKKSPKPVWNLNRNPLLRLLSALPKRMQASIIRKILK